MSRFVDGDKAAFELVYRELSGLVFRRLVYVLKDTEEAKEVLQAVFVRLWVNRDKVDVEKKIENYILRMADSMAIDLIRRNIRGRVVFENMLIDGKRFSDSIEEDFIREEDWMILEEGIHRLPPQQQVVFRLCKLEGQSYEEVSSLLHISTSTISSHLVAATKSLRQFAAQYHKEIKTIVIGWGFMDL